MWSITKNDTSLILFHILSTDYLQLPIKSGRNIYVLCTNDHCFIFHSVPSKSQNHFTVHLNVYKHDPNLDQHFNILSISKNFDGYVRQFYFHQRVVHNGMINYVHDLHLQNQWLLKDQNEIIICNSDNIVQTITNVFELCTILPSFGFWFTTSTGLIVIVEPVTETTFSFSLFDPITKRQVKDSFCIKIQDCFQFPFHIVLFDFVWNVDSNSPSFHYVNKTGIHFPDYNFSIDVPLSICQFAFNQQNNKVYILSKTFESFEEYEIISYNWFIHQQLQTIVVFEARFKLDSQLFLRFKSFQMMIDVLSNDLIIVCDYQTSFKILDLDKHFHYYLFKTSFHSYPTQLYLEQ